MTSTRFMISAAAAALLAVPAIAQRDADGQQKPMQAAESGQQGQNGRKTMPSSSGEKGGMANQSKQGFNAADKSSDEMTRRERDAMVASQDKVRDTLTDAGFTDIRVQSASYLVAAMSPQGEPVMMLIDTDRQIRDAYRAQDRQAENMKSDQETQSN